MARQKSIWHSIPWNTQEYLKGMEISKDKKIQIIALFARLKNYHFDNYEQMQFFIGRNQKAAKELECFPLDKIKATLQHLLDTADYKISLETVGKYVFEDIQTLEGDEPILILSDGEKIYDIERLKQLETDKRITYIKNKWCEINNGTR